MRREGVDQPTFRSVQPRAPSEQEARLLRRLSGSAGSSALRAQVERARVVGVCSCGCSSVQLSTDAAPLTVEEMTARSSGGRADHLAVQATGRSEAGAVTVVLHVVQGRVHQLELCAAEGVAVAAVTRLGRARVE